MANERAGPPRILLPGFSANAALFLLHVYQIWRGLRLLTTTVALARIVRLKSWSSLGT